MLRHLIFATAALIVLGVSATGCQPLVGTPSAKMRALASTSILADIAHNVAGDRMPVDSLIPLGIDPHEFQPTPKDTVKIVESQILILNGLGYETWLQKTLSNVGGNRFIITTTQGLTPLAAPTDPLSNPDPHMWLDPMKVEQYATTLRDGLAQADPEGTSAYTRNAAAYAAQLRELDAWIRAQVERIPPAKRLLVTNHESLGYFAKAYGFQVMGAVLPSVSSEASPSAQQMAELIRVMRASGATVIFVDVGANPNLARQISAETGARVVTDFYLETLSPPNGPAPTYIEMMRYDVTLMVDALAP
jgi:ABC-type Zn uptake system ZnuABC Zn-binding protein ZnuA